MRAKGVEFGLWPNGLAGVASAHCADFEPEARRYNGGSGQCAKENSDFCANYGALTPTQEEQGAY